LSIFSLTQKQKKVNPLRACQEGHISARFYISGSGLILKAQATDVYQDNLFGEETRRKAKRGEIKEFSRRSRRRFMEKVLAIEWNKLNWQQNLFFCTLTYHSVPEDGRAVKRHLDNFRRELDRFLGKNNYFVIWKMEFQRREAVHYHLMLYVYRSPWKNVCIGSYLFLVKLRKWFSAEWHAVTKEATLEHLKAGTRVERPRKKHAVISYLFKYAGYKGDKEYQHRLPENTSGWGRFWGIWHRVNLIVCWKTFRIFEIDFFVVRRILRGYVKNRVRYYGRYHGLWVIVSSQKDCNILMRVLHYLQTPPFQTDFGYGRWIRKVEQEFACKRQEVGFGR